MYSATLFICNHFTGVKHIQDTCKPVEGRPSGQFCVDENESDATVNVQEKRKREAS